MLKLYNTITKQKEVFKPLNAKHISMYVCGPTVYDDIHIGNARPIIVFDVLFRLLKHIYPDVTYIRNITDIDDKIINKSIELNKTVAEITNLYINSFQIDISALNVLKPTIEPKATDHIASMITLIKTLINNSYAYINESHVFFDVTKFAEYGTLSGIKQNELHQGSRVEVSNLKKNASDFVLWKPSKTNEIGWESPWSYGRPGWHLECSAMAKKYLGEQFDIHGGGQDLIFPHHENERAQSICSAKSTTNMANYWLHNGYVMIEGQKMSKSLNNFITLKKLFKQYSGSVIRFALLSTHYHQPLNFQASALQQASTIINKWQTLLNNNTIQATVPSTEFIHALSDNLNIPNAITVLHTNINALSKLDTKSEQYKLLYSQILANMNLLGLSFAEKKVSINTQEIETIIKNRTQAKENKNFQLADKIRTELLEQGIILEDSKQGTTYKIKS